ncbi:transcription intermediary factor 1-beta-like isoform X2 [Asterias rubens]|nr:transcription intermediary factor 1-beta-like isoform X2 [Asterias rubens]
MSTITCGNCDEKDEAVIYCQECAEYLCEICNNAHLRSKKTKDHKTAPIKPPKCEVHTDRDHCETSCTEDHQSHIVHDLSQAIESSKNAITELVTNVGHRLENLANHGQFLESLHNKHKQMIQQKHKIITDDADRKVAEIREQEKKLKEKVEQFCNERGKQLEEHIIVNRRKEEKIKQHLEKVTNERKQVEDSDLLEKRKSHTQDFHDALAVDQPTGCSCLNFQDFKDNSAFNDDEIYLMFEKKRSMTDSEKDDIMMNVGTRVVRGKNWPFGPQDGIPPREGEIVGISSTKEVSVRWDAGETHHYYPRFLELA